MLSFREAKRRGTCCSPTTEITAVTLPESSAPTPRAPPKPAPPSPDSSTRTHPPSLRSHPQTECTPRPLSSPPQTISSIEIPHLPPRPSHHAAAIPAPAAPPRHSSPHREAQCKHPACATHPRPSLSKTSLTGLRQSQTQSPELPARRAPPITR